MPESSTTAEYKRLEAEKAPAAAQYPDWLKRYFPPAALYTVFAVVIGAVATCVWFFADAKFAKQSNAQFAQKLEAEQGTQAAILGKLEAMNARLDIIQSLVIDHAKDEAFKQGVVSGSTITRAEKKSAKQEPK